ncbi:hypothetical protein GCM10028819_14710 [Spirosoma humi]
MKNILILMLSLVASTASFATSNEPSKPAAVQTRLVMTDAHTIKLYVQPLETKGQLSIQDAIGRTVYTESVNLQKGLNQQFNFANLSTGTYRLTLVAGTQALNRTFVVQADPNTSFIVQ